MRKIAIKTLIVCISVLSFVANVNAQDTIRETERTIVRSSPAVSNSENAPAASDLKRGEFGVRYMPTFSALDLKTYNGDVIKGSATVSHGFGIMAAFNMSNHVGVQAEINYYKVSQEYADRNINREVTIRYINIPLMLSLNTSKSAPVNLNFVAGPQFGFSTGSSINKTDGESTDTLQVVLAVKKGDVGLAFGAGLEFALNSAHTTRLDFGYRGFYGLVDMDGNTTGEDTYNVLVKTARKTNAIYLGFTLLF